MRDSLKYSTVALHLFESKLYSLLKGMTNIIIFWVVLQHIIIKVNISSASAIIKMI
jgi:hypothetical protein